MSFFLRARRGFPFLDHLNMITIGFSSHHAETLPYAKSHMERHGVIVLEEAPLPEFAEMLQCRISIDEYVMGTDSGFPEFQRRMCALLRELYREGRKIVQIEPYLETLLEIHERLAGGDTPEGIVRNQGLNRVYQAEKRATGALLDYYKRSVTASFGDVVEAVKNFARADAERLSLRERLRAEAIKPLASQAENIYVEAGYIHYPLYIYLRRVFGRDIPMRVVYLLASVVRRLGGRRRNMGPGDVLTLHYALHEGLAEDRANLLAARSLIYIKLLHTDELVPGESAVPHSEDQARVNRLVDDLSLGDCRFLFEKVRRAGRERALAVVRGFFGQRAELLSEKPDR